MNHEAKPEPFTQEEVFDQCDVMRSLARLVLACLAFILVLAFSARCLANVGWAQLVYLVS